MIYWLKRRYWSWHHKFIVKRAAARQKKGFNLHNTFVLPTSFGWATIAVATCLFILGTNYQNNVVLGICYLLIAMTLLSLFHCYFYFTDHRIEILPIKPDFANRQLNLQLNLYSSNRYEKGELFLWLGNTPFILDTEESEQPAQLLTLKLPQMPRGIHHLPSIKVQAVYGIGLFKSWSYLIYSPEVIVFPSVIKHPVKLHSQNSEDGGNLSSDTQIVVSDNLQGIRSYQKTDPMHHVSWKHVAKGQGMVSKDFLENTGITGWIRIHDYLHEDVENALKILCFQIQELHKDKVKFGLDLGFTKVLPSIGDEHQLECLSLLAAYSSNPQAFTRKSEDPS